MFSPFLLNTVNTLCKSHFLCRFLVDCLCIIIYFFMTAAALATLMKLDMQHKVIYF